MDWHGVSLAQRQQQLTNMRRRAAIARKQRLGRWKPPVMPEEPEEPGSPRNIPVPEGGRSFPFMPTPLVESEGMERGAETQVQGARQRFYGQPQSVGGNEQPPPDRPSPPEPTAATHSTPPPKQTASEGKAPAWEGVAANIEAGKKPSFPDIGSRKTTTGNTVVGASSQPPPSPMEQLPLPHGKGGGGMEQLPLPHGEGAGGIEQLPLVEGRQPAQPDETEAERRKAELARIVEGNRKGPASTPSLPQSEAERRKQQLASIVGKNRVTQQPQPPLEIVPRENVEITFTEGEEKSPATVPPPQAWDSYNPTFDEPPLTHQEAAGEEADESGAQPSQTMRAPRPQRPHPGTGIAAASGNRGNDWEPPGGGPATAGETQPQAASHKMDEISRQLGELLELTRATKEKVDTFEDKFDELEQAIEGAGTYAE